MGLKAAYVFGKELTRDRERLNRSFGRCRNLFWLLSGNEAE